MKIKKWLRPCSYGTKLRPNANSCLYGRGKRSGLRRTLRRDKEKMRVLNHPLSETTTVHDLSLILTININLCAHLRFRDGRVKFRPKIILGFYWNFRSETLTVSSFHKCPRAHEHSLFHDINCHSFAHSEPVWPRPNFEKGLTFPDQRCPKVATQYICCQYSSFLSESRPLMK